MNILDRIDRALFRHQRDGRVPGRIVLTPADWDTFNQALMLSFAPGKAHSTSAEYLGWPIERDGLVPLSLVEAGSGRDFLRVRI